MIGTVLIILLTIFVFRSEAEAKSSVIQGREDIIRKAGNANGGILDLDAVAGFELHESTEPGSGTLGEGNTDPFTIESGPERVIITIQVDLTWEDEDDIRRIRLYENTPDEFTVSIIDPKGGIIVRAEKNPQGGSGSLSLTLDLSSPEEVERFIDKGDFTVEVTLSHAGDYEARLGMGVINLSDDSNDYSIQIKTTFMSPPFEE